MSEHEELCRRLRRQANAERWSTMPPECREGIDLEDAEEAADAIEALVRERDGLREALKRIERALKVTDLATCQNGCALEAVKKVWQHAMTPQPEWIKGTQWDALTASAPTGPHSPSAAESQHRPLTPEPARD